MCFLNININFVLSEIINVKLHYNCRFKSSSELMLFCYIVLPTQNKIYLILSYLRFLYRQTDSLTNRGLIKNILLNDNNRNFIY